MAPPILVSAVCTVYEDREKVLSSGATYSSKRSLFTRIFAYRANRPG